MASQMMHLYVGKKFVERHENIANLPQFYLGCIIPDSVYANGSVTKEIRWSAHLRSRIIKKWYRNNIEFYRRNVEKVNKDLLLGYVIHNITDAAFDKHFIFSVWRGLKRKKIQPITSMGLRWDDCFRFDYDQRKEVWWRNEVLPALKKAVPAGINGIGENLAEKLLIGITDEESFTFPEGNPVMVTIKLLDELAEIVCKIVDDFIHE